MVFRADLVQKGCELPWDSVDDFCRRGVAYGVGGCLVPEPAQEPLRLFVVAPTAYRKRQSGRLYYRRPAYVLTTDPLLQIYFDRWQIEVNHRQKEDTLGVGQAQLWNETAVPKQPVLVVAAYSALLLASLIALGPPRGVAYTALPKWRRNAKRPSCLDLITLLRNEMPEKPHLLAPLGLTPSFRSFTAVAAA